MAGRKEAEEGLVVFLHSSRYDKVYQAVSIILTASSMGRPCRLFLFLEALGSFVAGTWDEVGEREEGTASGGWEEKVRKGFEESNYPSLYDMLSSARQEAGGVEIYACSNSVKVLGLDPAEVRRKVDEVIGLPTMLQLAGSAKHVLYI